MAKKPTKLDPKQVFVIEMTTRKSIADDLNELLDRKEFTPGDPRLTDKVCRKYADGLYDIGNRCGEVAESTECNMLGDLQHRTLMLLGIKDDLSEVE